MGCLTICNNTDCGAGVGRVSKELLLHVFQEVDLLEPSQHLLETAGALGGLLCVCDIILMWGRGNART